MKTIVSVGSYDFLFPDPGTAAKAVTLLSKALPVRDMSYQGKIEIDPEHPAPIEMKVLTMAVKMVRRDGTPAEEKKPRAMKLGRELRAPRQLMLTENGGPEKV